jgi:hypothetical protein
VTANTASSTVSVLLGTGDGSFEQATSLPTGEGAWPWAVAIADLNNDLKPDLAVANYHASTIGVLFGDGRGGFSWPWQYPTGSHPVAIAAADLNSDAKLDLVTADLHGDTASVLLGSGGGAFELPRSYPVGDQPSTDVEYPSGLALADLDDDGTLDLAVANYETDRLAVLRGTGDGRFEPAAHWPTDASPVDVVVADLNGDGLGDLATANYEAGSASVLINATPGAPPQTPPAPPPPPPSPPAPAPRRSEPGPPAGQQDDGGIASHQTSRRIRDASHGRWRHANLNHHKRREDRRDWRRSRCLRHVRALGARSC